MTISRRHTLAGALALAITTAVPKPLAATALTAEERDLLARVPAWARTGLARGLHDGVPVVRELYRSICLATPEHRVWILTVLERMLPVWDRISGRGLSLSQAVAAGHIAEDELHEAIYAPVAISAADVARWTA